MKPDKILLYVKALIEEGERLVNQQFRAGPNYFQHGQDSYVPLEEFSHWSASCRHLVSMLGKTAEAWKSELCSEGPNRVETAMSMLGCMRSISDAINRGLLNRVEDLLAAEMFDNLLEQALYLCSKNYYRAAGVLGRAVLEEHLRHLCERNSCIPAKERPTLNDFASELYRLEHLDKLQLKNVESMAAIGNAAAHPSEKDISEEDAEHLLIDIRRFVDGAMATR